MNRVQIVLARLNDDIEAVPGQWTYDRGDGINAVAKLRAIVKPTAMMWLRDGTADDVKRASCFAAANGYTVHTYPSTERDPLRRAKADALNGVSRTDRQPSY